MSYPTPNNQIKSPTKGDLVAEQMERRVASGEFGQQDHFDVVGYTEAMRKLIDQPTKTKFNPVCPLRTKEGSPLILTRQKNAHVLFECAEVQKEVVIPAGVKVLVLKHSKRNSKPGPDGSVVYVTEESHGGKRPDDTAKIENAMRETADPLPFAPGEWQGEP